MSELQEIVIEEYVPERHAASIAEMWNRSAESWGGDGAYRTEESVLREHENSPMLKLFLAVSGSEVIGYCSFSHYKEDTGALYIALLNVRPDYHGRKVGKALVRRSIEETIKLGWRGWIFILGPVMSRQCLLTRKAGSSGKTGMTPLT